MVGEVVGSGLDVQDQDGGSARSGKVGGDEGEGEGLLDFGEGEREGEADGEEGEVEDVRLIVY
jgi:hypothetical protein